MFWWPVLTLKRGYNETDSINRGGSRQGGDFVNKVKQADGDYITSTTSTQAATTDIDGPDDAPFQYTFDSIVGTSTEHIHMSTVPSTATTLTAVSAFPSLDASINPKSGPDTTAFSSVLQKAPEASGIPALAAAMLSTAATPSPSPVATRLPPGAPMLSSTAHRTQNAPTDHPPSLPNSSSHDNGLSPEEITIIVAVVVAFVIFLALLAIGIRWAILRRRQHEARERARRIQEVRRPAMSHLPPALKKPSASSLRTAAAVAGGGHNRNGEEEKEFHDGEDHNAEFRIVIRPPPGYRTPQSGATTPVDSHPPPGNRRPGTSTIHSPTTIGRAVSSQSGQHWSLDTEHGSVRSESSQKVPLSRLNLGTRKSE